jgi:hypothetical protein
VTHFEHLTGTAFELAATIGGAIGAGFLVSIGSIEFPTSLPLAGVTATPTGVDIDTEIDGHRTRITVTQDTPIALSIRY